MLTTLKKIFTWWNRDTVGTRIKTIFSGKLIGVDNLGNKTNNFNCNINMNRLNLFAHFHHGIHRVLSFPAMLATRVDHAAVNTIYIYIELLEKDVTLMMNECFH